ncbi:CYTH and CHAD domain-containing protein [Hydrogenophaga sp.]|uniref:CYTH and CHAD domain-containing protein n=1 Tax=Hydrogenophaga sp. TaxID=1904254 RepID=UPI00261155D4|nr:CYTH and CHAD domain-containing protein [Hydrogenophaga sp.]MCW5653975.1 CHAD domain-containing protein [Hydrogenophaga sp.]
MAQETELKLELHPDDLPRLLAHPLLAGQAPRRARLLNTYYDTAALALRAQRLAVRERRVGRRTLLTVKTAGSSVGGLSRRGEWEAPSRPGRFDFASLVDDSALAEQLGRVAWQLVPVFRTDFTRRTWLLTHGAARVELALDQGVIATGSAGDGHRLPILELELELLEGPVGDLLDLAHTLALGPQGRSEQGLRLLPADRSKAERGYALFMGERLQPVKAQPLQLQAGMHPVQALRAAAFACLAHLQANAAGLRQPPLEGGLPDPEFVHQARVALRRLRTGLRLFAPYLPGRFVGYWSAQWREVAGQLGEARDWDVFAGEWLPGLLAELAPEAGLQAEASALGEWVASQRREAGLRALQTLSGSAHALRLLAFMHAVWRLPPADPVGGTAPTRDSVLVSWAGDALRERHARLRREARTARRQGPEGRHQLRIELKKLRYAQEFLGGLLPAGRMARSTALLAQAQELLGGLNDLSTAQGLLARVPASLSGEVVARLQDGLQARLDFGLRSLPAMERALERAALPKG